MLLSCERIEKREGIATPKPQSNVQERSHEREDDSKVELFNAARETCKEDRNLQEKHRPGVRLSEKKKSSAGGNGFLKGGFKRAAALRVPEEELELLPSYDKRKKLSKGSERDSE